MPADAPPPPPAASQPARVLSGIQPTGRFHWGNYFGAIRQYIELQTTGDAYYFIADLHALTTVREPDRLRSLVHDAAVDLLALGLDPARATLFVQSDVPEVTELTWLLMTVCPMGLLERCHAYKDKKTRGLAADAGLFAYPVLMSADILAYDATLVPVGEDQVQHIEVCRDLAGSFNHLYGDVFTLPAPRLVAGGGRVPGTDGQKMSKSYHNTIDVFKRWRPRRRRSCGSPPTRGRWKSQRIRRETISSRSIRCWPALPTHSRWRRNIGVVGLAMAK